MCNHYTLHPQNIPTWAEWAGFAVAQSETQASEHIWPKRAGFVARIANGERLLDTMAWGVPLKMAGKRAGTTITKHVTNVRNLASPFWRGTLANPAQRCLVPFSRFAEPRSGKDPVSGRPAEYWFEVSDTPVAAFAGIWRSTDEQRAFAFLTCEPNPLVAPCHPKAMPVILLPQDYERWLTGTIEEAVALQAPFPSQLMALCAN